jgi:hypothetical protein
VVSGRDQYRYRHDPAFEQDGNDLDKVSDIHGYG